MIGLQHEHLLGWPHIDIVRDRWCLICHTKPAKDTLSVDVVKKAAEIEKLAKSVKDRMRG